MTTRVLILCVGNSARSQMAEGLLRHLASRPLDVFSAGSQPSRVHPLAVQVMAERGFDISQHRSKHQDEFRSQPFDYVITVCAEAAEVCPVFPGPARRVSWSFPDPAALRGNPEEQIQAFRAVRDTLEQQLRQWLTSLPHSAAVEGSSPLSLGLWA